MPYLPQFLLSDILYLVFDNRIDNNKNAKILQKPKIVTKIHKIL